MSSPGNKDARYEDTNRVQEDFTPAGNSNADKSPHHPNRAVKQTTARISKAELEPAIQSQARQNLESSWHRRGKWWDNWSSQKLGDSYKSHRHELHILNSMEMIL